MYNVILVWEILKWRMAQYKEEFPAFGTSFTLTPTMSASASTLKYVYKILPNTAFYQGIPIPVPDSYEIKPTEVDARDGYVHMSTLTQLGDTLNRFFSSDEDKVVQLLKVDYKRLNAFKVVKWEKASNGDVFPHLYATLVGEYVRNLRLVARGKQGWQDTLGKLVEEGWLEN